MEKEGGGDFQDADRGWRTTPQALEQLLKVTIDNTQLQKALLQMNLETDSDGMLSGQTVGNIASITELWLEQTKEKMPALYRRYKVFYDEINRFKPKNK